MKRVLFAAGAAYLTAVGAAFSAPIAHPSPLAALDAATSVQVTETMMSSSGPEPVHAAAMLRIKVQRPGQARIEQSKPGATTPDAVLVTDGKTLTEYVVARKQYRKGNSPPLADFGYDGLPALNAYPATAKSVATTLNGKSALLYTVAQNANGQNVTHKLWLDTPSRLPLRQSIYTGAGAKAKEVMRIVFTNWSLDKPIEPAAFAFAPPTGVTEFKEAAAPALLAAGTVAPNFTVQDRAGNPVKLSDYKGKIVVLDFWATWCGPCQQSLPHTNAVAQQFKDKNVVVLAVNVSDTKAAFDKWLPLHKDFDAITFAIDTSAPGQDVGAKLYNVTGIPTQYVIGADGKILQSFVGFSGPTDDLANALKAAGANG